MTYSPATVRLGPLLTSDVYMIILSFVSALDLHS